jgi:ABC-type glycerol-3-phosphate transport system substrate-binding protein
MFYARKVHIRGVLSSIAVAFVLTACAGNLLPGITPAGHSNAVTISFATWEHELPLYAPLAHAFMAEHPQIKVVLVRLDDLIYTPEGTPAAPDTLRRIVSGADTATAFFVTPEAFGSSLLLDLIPLMDTDPTFQRDDFYPGTLEHSTVANGTWLLPHYLAVPLLAYNQDLFGQAGLPKPAPNWTWNDLLGAAEQLARTNGSMVETYGLFDPHGELAFLAALQSQKVDLLHMPVAEVEFDAPGIVAAVERVRALTHSGALLQFATEGESASDPFQLIHDGRVGIWGSEFVDLHAGADAAGPATFPVGYVPYPAGAIQRLNTEGYIISAGTAHPMAAWHWIEFLSRQPLGPPSGHAGRIPARQSLATRSGVWLHLDATARTAAIQALAHLSPAAAQATDRRAFDQLVQLLPQISADSTDPHLILQATQQEWQEQRDRAHLTPTPAPDTRPVTVATPAPQEAPAGTTAVIFTVPGDHAVHFRALAQAFHTLHPDIFIQIQSPAPFTHQPHLAEIAHMGDCFSWSSRPQSDADFAALLDIRPLLDADPTFPQHDYPSLFLDIYRSNNGLYGLPYALDLPVLTYDRTWFDQAGIAPPDVHWSPADFQAAAEMLTLAAAAPEQYGYVSAHDARQELRFFIDQFGGRLALHMGETVRPNFEDPTVIDAVQWYLDLAQVHAVMPPMTLPSGQVGAQMSLGFTAHKMDAGMWFSHASQHLLQPDAATGMAPLPVGSGGLHRADLRVRGFHIAAETTVAGACWEWLTFLTSDLSNLQGSIPARTSLAQSDAFVTQAHPSLVALYQAYQPALTWSDALSHPDSRLELYWFFQAVRHASEQETDLRQELARAQHTTTAFMECLEGSDAPDRAVICAHKVDPDYQDQMTADSP